MKFDIVVKKRQNVLKVLELKCKLAYQLHSLHIPKDELKKMLQRIIHSVDTHISSDFDSLIHIDPEDPSFYKEEYKEINKEKVIILATDVRKLSYEYVKLKQKEIKLAGPIHMYEYGKKGLWLKVRNIFLTINLVLVVFCSALVLHLEIVASFNFFFDFRFFESIEGILGTWPIRVLKFFSISYLIVAVIYANCRIEIKHWYLMVKRSTPLTSLMFYTM